MTLFKFFTFLLLLILTGCSTPQQMLPVSSAALRPRVKGMMDGRIACTEPFKFVIDGSTGRESLILYTECERTGLTVILLSPLGDVRAKLLALDTDVRLIEARGDLSRLHPDDLLFIAMVPGLKEEMKAVDAARSDDGCIYNFILDPVQVKITLPGCEIQE